MTLELALWTLLPRDRDWLVLQESTRRPRRSLTQAQTSVSHHLIREAGPRRLAVPRPPMTHGPVPLVTTMPWQLYRPVCLSSGPVVLSDGKLGTGEPRPDGRLH